MNVNFGNCFAMINTHIFRANDVKGLANNESLRRTEKYSFAELAFFPPGVGLLILHWPRGQMNTLIGKRNSAINFFATNYFRAIRLTIPENTN